MMAARYVLYHDDRYDEDWRTRVMHSVVRHLQLHDIDVRVESRRTFKTRSRRGGSGDALLRDQFGVLEDERSGEYRVLDFHDWTVPFRLRQFAMDPRCQVILKAQYRPARGANPSRFMRVGPNRGLPDAWLDVVRPWTYFDQQWPLQQERHLELRSTTPTERRMYFRGGLVGFQWTFVPSRLMNWLDLKNVRFPVIQALRREDILNPDQEGIPYGRYLEEMASHRIALSMFGTGEMCQRDVEAFGVGACLLRPRLRNRFHDELRPNFHYVSVDTDPEKDAPDVVAARIAERYHAVIDQPDYLASVARNGAAWYDRNVRLPASMDLTAELLELDP